MPAHHGVTAADLTPRQGEPGAPYDLVVLNAKPITADPPGHDFAGVAVRDGRIAKLLRAHERPTARRVVDGAGRHLLPGLIDSHVHFRTPGLTHKEDWEHGSRAAVAGGVTTVIDMPNTRPAFHDPARVGRRVGLVAGHSLVDFRFHLGVDPAAPARLAKATPAEATSAKVFLTGHHTAPDVVRDPACLAEVFAHAAAANLRLCLHAEDDGVLRMLDQVNGEPAAYQDYERVRPRSAAIVAVAAIIGLVERHGTAVHVLHVSSAEEVELLAAAAATGLPITFEVTGHHLSFTGADARRQGARVRLSPSLRRSDDQDRLWQAVLAGQVATIGSDHAPHTVAEKLLPPPDAPPGLPGVQELLPAVLTGMRRRAPHQPVEAHLRRIVELMAARPADLFGLAARKGRLRVGADADLVLLDADRAWTFAADQVRSKCGWSAYEGWTMTGRVALTCRRGEIVYDARDRVVFGEPTGRFLEASTPADLMALAPAS